MYIKHKTTIKPSFKALACALLIAVSAALPAQTKSTYAFVQRDSTLYLDVYRPQNPRADKAAVMAVLWWATATTLTSEKWLKRLHNAALPLSAPTTVWLLRTAPR